MIKILSVEEAQATILRREMALEPDVPPALQASLDRFFGRGATPETAVAHILRDVRQKGDAALRDWTLKIDGVQLAGLSVSQFDREMGGKHISTSLYEALGQAAHRIRRFHELQPLPNWTTDTLGGVLGQRVTPIRRVGVYVPGGTAPLPSSLLMAVIPAQVAGVTEIVVATPPGKDGKVANVILAAAQICGIETIYTLGGAQAIAALAFGTESVRRVDKVVGAGGLFTTLATRQVYGMVGIDGLYGPTETAVVADDTANPAWVAADLLAQAEHDVLATAILFTPSLALAKAVQAEIGQQMEHLSRANIIAQSLKGRGGIVLTTSLDEACQLASDFAAEHTCLAVADPAAYAGKIPNAGGLFIGERSFEVLGDYVAGPSHVMPTSGTARFSSPLGVYDFQKLTSLIQLDDATSASLSPIAAQLAHAEGLTAHENAARKRG